MEITEECIYNEYHRKFLKEANETMCMEKHSISLSSMKKLFEKVVKIIIDMNSVLNFYCDSEFEEHCFICAFASCF